MYDVQSKAQKIAQFFGKKKLYILVIRIFSHVKQKKCPVNSQKKKLFYCVV